MTFVSSKFKNHLLPIGFTAIILFMISTLILSASHIENSNKTVLNIQNRTNIINDAINTMSRSINRRSYILFKMVQSKDAFEIDELMMEMNTESTKFTAAREILNSQSLSQNKLRLLEEQADISIQNKGYITYIFNLLMNEGYQQALLILNSQSLPRSETILNIVGRLQIEAKNETQLQSIEAEKISSAEVNTILVFNFLSIFLSCLLMFFLIRKQRESDIKLSLLANTDTLTNLPNRENFIQQINTSISSEPDSHFSIVFLDIDYFKSINDNYGHEVGDQVLKRFTNTIKTVISNADVLSRFGGDEFVLLLKHTSDSQKIKNLLRSLSNELDTTFHIDNNQVFVSASIGACDYPNDGLNAKELLKSADIAMYAAKQNGRNCFQFFSVDDSKKLDREHTLSHSLETILRNKNKDNQLSLVYQPLVNMAEEDFNECEALIRWNDLDGNLVSTAEFIEIAEKSNLIEKVNTFVIEQTSKQQAIWQQEGLKNIRININLSGNKRIFNDLFKTFSDSLYRYDLSPELFGIELTERTMHEISKETYKELDYFRCLGMKISIDDFGTGYSSLSYLKDLPITTVKIDKEFITGLPNDKINVALVKAIITLAHSLEFDVIAEGVETQEQFNFLKSVDCNIAQGYLLHRPLASKEIIKLKLVA